MVVAWRQEMNIDHGGLDADHHQQHELIRRFVATPAEEERRDAALALLHALRDGSARHFAREERVQALVRYPAREEHKAQHRRLLVLLDDIIQQLEYRDSPFTFAYVKGKSDELLQFWFLDHLAKADLGLRHHMAAAAPR